MDTKTLTAEDKQWLMLIASLMFESGAVIDGKVVGADDVARLITRDLMGYSAATGVGGYFDRLFGISLKVHVEKYASLGKWAEIFTKGIKYDPEKVKMIALRLASEARESKRDGCDVANTLISTLMYEPESTTATFNNIVLQRFHEKVAELSDTQPDLVIGKLNLVRDKLLSGGVNVHLIGNYALQKPDVSWKSLQSPKATLFKVPMGEAVTNNQKSVLIGVGGSESTFLYQTTNTGISWQSDELIPLYILTQYLSQTEGPLWKSVRGNGYAYGANIYVNPDRKTLTLSLYRCADVIKAYGKTKEETIVKEEHLDSSEFEAAKRSLISELMEREQSVFGAGKMYMLSQFREIDPEFTNYSLAIATHPSKLKELSETFPGIEQRNITSLQLAPTFTV